MDYAPTTSDSGQAGSLPHDGPAASLLYEEGSPPEFANEAPKRSKRRLTAHLKLVPETRELRDKLHAKCREVAATSRHLAWSLSLSSRVSGTSFR